MKHVWMALLLGVSAGSALGQGKPEVLATGLKNPESVVVGPDGQVYASVIGEFNKDGDGAVVRIADGKATPLAEGLNDPKGLATYQQWIYATDRDRVWRIDLKGKVDLLAAPNAFPSVPQFLNDIVVDPESGMVYVTDSGDLKGAGGAVYRIAQKGTVSLVADASTIPGLNIPNGLAMDGASHLLLVDFGTGKLFRINLATGKSQFLKEGFGGGDGLAWDHFGRLFISDYKNGKIFGIPHPGKKPVELPVKFENAADICVHHASHRILVPDMKAGTVTAVPAVIPGAEVDTTPLGISIEPAFPKLKWAGWTPETEDGRPNPLRPILLTHAGDGSNRIFIIEQRGVIYSFQNDQNASEAKVFLDIRDRVQYDDRSNEEGLLGLAFHPKFKETGELFVFYTPKLAKGGSRENLVSRFKVSADNPNQGDKTSEQPIYRYKNRPFWNHDGGTICFGPDGFLYITHGDGGAGSDPFDNGQNLMSPLGKVLRIDINNQGEGKPYAIPADNPFVGRQDALPEIWAYGLRNIWRMAFDRETGQLWAGEVGQNLYEEINIIVKGGNYGWNRRESFHPFGAKGVGVNPDMIDPIWEYHHEVGKSITGGHVYRGTRIPELQGKYIYGDYVSNKVWALTYDEQQKRVVANQPIPDRGRPIFSFGEDEKGEVYILTSTTTGREGIYWFKK